MPARAARSSPWAARRPSTAASGRSRHSTTISGARRFSSRATSRPVSSDAARIFGPQKGAGPDAVAELEERLGQLAERYRAEHGIDVRAIPGSGAAGGLAGGLAAVGARLVPGATLVAETVDLHGAIASASLVLTGEGRLDATSFAGKVVGHVVHEAAALHVPAGIVAGAADPDAVPDDVPCLTLVELGGSVEVALADAERLAADAAEALARTL